MYHSGRKPNLRGRHPIAPRHTTLRVPTFRAFQSRQNEKHRPAFRPALPDRHRQDRAFPILRLLKHKAPPAPQPAAPKQGRSSAPPPSLNPPPSLISQQSKQETYLRLDNRLVKNGTYQRLNVFARARINSFRGGEDKAAFTTCPVALTMIAWQGSPDHSMKTDPSARHGPLSACHNQFRNGRWWHQLCRKPWHSR